MRKNLLFIAVLLCTISNVKAQTNLFDANDVDADGWLWFNTQAKIDKYIGEDKAIRLVDAAFEPFEETTVNADFMGAGTDGILGGINAQKGVIILPKSLKTSTYNGGGILLQLPSCKLLSVAFSCDEQMRPLVKGGAGKSETIDLAIIKTFSFLPLSRAGQKKWEDLQTLENDNKFKLESTTPVTAHILNGNSKPLYIQGIKVLIADKTGTGISDINDTKVVFANNVISTDELASITIYNLCGQIVTSANTTSIDLNSLEKGIYIVKVKGANKEQTLKVNVR